MSQLTTRIDFCTRNEMRINNTFFPHKEQHKYTFCNSRGQRSMIDFIITNRAIIPSQILDVRALTSANLGTDHNLILCKIMMEQPTKSKKVPIYVEKYNLESLSLDATRKLYESRLEHKLQNATITGQTDVESCWQQIKTCIEQAAYEAIGKRRININATNHTKPWFCEEVRELADRKRKSYLAYKSSPTEDERTKYLEIRNSVNARIKTIKRDYWSRFTSDMDHDLYGAQRKIWKMLKNRKKPVNEYVQTKGIPPETWEEYFRQLYRAEEALELEVYETTEESTISEKELEAKLKKLKNRKAAGVDNIPNELLKYGGRTFLAKLTIFFNLVLSSQQIPEEWHSSITIPIFKKGQKTCPGNYRGITLLNTTMKLFTSVLKQKLEAQIETREEQQGFRKNRSTTDALFIIKQLKEKSMEFNKPLYICFVDLTKAFDKVRLEDIVRLLIDKRTPSNIVKIIRLLNTGNTTKIKAGEHTTANIPTPGGIRQGDSLSPFLFNLLMDEIIREVASLNLGYRMSRNRVSMVCYADDAAILAETEDDLQKQLFKFYQTSQQLNLNISTDKTKAMTIAKEPIRCKLVVEDKPIEQVNQFRYLGLDISSGHDPTKDLRNQINKATSLSGCLREIVWSNQYMRTDSKIRIYKTCIRPVMTYGIETREETSKTKNMLRVAEMKTLRTILGKTRKDRIRNTDIREQCGIVDVVRWGRQRRRGWYDHVRRMDESRLPRVALEGKPAGNRAPGRPHKRWKDSWKSTSQEKP